MCKNTCTHYVNVHVNWISWKIFQLNVGVIMRKQNRFSVYLYMYMYKYKYKYMHVYNTCPSLCKYSTLKVSFL